MHKSKNALKIDWLTDLSALLIYCHWVYFCSPGSGGWKAKHRYEYFLDPGEGYIAGNLETRPKLFLGISTPHFRFSQLFLSYLAFSDSLTPFWGVKVVNIPFCEDPTFSQIIKA